MARPQHGVRPLRRSTAKPEGPSRVVTAQLTVTPASLARLLSISGTQTDFILSSADGSTTVRVGLAISSVPDGEMALGKSGLMLDWTRSTLSSGQRRVPLTRMELRLLAALLEHAPATAPKKELIARMWPGAKPGDGDAALPVWIFALRRRFTALGFPSAIRTVRAAGYSLGI